MVSRRGHKPRYRRISRDPSRAWLYSDVPAAADSRAQSGTVGFLGDPESLTVLNYDDPTPGSWQADWVGDTALLIKAADQTIDGYLINAVVVSDTGFSLTVRNSVIAPPSTTDGGVICGGALLTVEDTTVVGTESNQSGLSCNNGGKIVVDRCHVTGFQDAVSFGAWKIRTSFLRVNDQLTFHCDGIQELVFADSEVIDCDIDASGNPLDPNIGVTGAMTIMCTNATIRNNRLDGGAYPLRFQTGAGLGVDGAIVEDNDWGPLHTVGPHNVPDPTMIAVWSNNFDENGAPLPQPS